MISSSQLWAIRMSSQSLNKCGLRSMTATNWPSSRCATRLWTTFYQASLHQRWAKLARLLRSRAKMKVSKLSLGRHPLTISLPPSSWKASIQCLSSTISTTKNRRLAMSDQFSRFKAWRMKLNLESTFSFKTKILPLIRIVTSLQSFKEKSSDAKSRYLCMEVVVLSRPAGPILEKKYPLSRGIMKESLAIRTEALC